MKIIKSIGSGVMLAVGYLIPNVGALISGILSKKGVKKEKLGLFISLVFIVLCVLFFAAVIAVPYNYLAGGKFGNFIITTISAPFVVIALCLLCASEDGGVVDDIKACKQSDGECSHWPRLNKLSLWLGKGFWWMAFCFSLPVLLNGISVFLKWGGYEWAAQKVFEWRYWAILIVPIKWLQYLSFILVYRSAKRWYRTTIAKKQLSGSIEI